MFVSFWLSLFLSPNWC